MKFAYTFANFGDMGDTQTLVDLAVDAEVAGWDAVFLWDHVNWAKVGFHVDPWIVLALIADRTDRLLIGTSVTPIARRRPTKLAREILTLHQLSGGRFVFGAGNGAWPSEFRDLGDSDSLKDRAEMLDEGLELLQELWCGEPVDHDGTHYKARVQTFMSGGAEIPIWLGATWPNRKPFRRAAHYDGVMALNQDFSQLSTEEVSEISQYIAANRDTDNPFNLGVGLSVSNDPEADSERALAYEAAGANWWLDGFSPRKETIEVLRARIRRGPPRI